MPVLLKGVKGNLKGLVPRGNKSVEGNANDKILLVGGMDRPVPTDQLKMAPSWRTTKHRSVG